MLTGGAPLKRSAASLLKTLFDEFARSASCLLKGGAPLMSFGVMGGPMQAQGHLQMVLRTQLWDQDVQMAADAPRWQVTEGLGVACEAAMGRDTLEALSAMGHQIDADAPEAAFAFGGAQLIHRLPDGGYAGGSDPRKDGAAVGF